jgi:hypothetical protein
MAMAYVETGRFADAEHTSTELLDVQRGKVDPMSHRWGSSEEMMARALVGQGKYAEALPHAKAADVALAATSRAPAEKAQSERAHQMLLDIEAKLGKHSG